MVVIQVMEDTLYACIAHGNWLSNEACQSSTWCELVAVGRVLEAVANKLHGARVQWFTDNQNVVRILQVGSGKPHLKVVALKVFRRCVVHNINAGASIGTKGGKSVGGF